MTCTYEQLQALIESMAQSIQEKIHEEIKANNQQLAQDIANALLKPSSNA